ncbi:MAG: TIGR04283 family arsenosugar biosynthesis glycosyltransferase [Pirellulales bacterium]|nr:TIGR04283 family arsenosugar biosynthesis glycosyltransferase [Pirellulales bacterium]
MDLSVIIPTLNESPRLADAIDAAWHLNPHEVIVVDGKSDDDTPVIGRASPCTFVESTRGRGFQLNVGANAASGDVLLFLHVDCRLAAQASRQISAALEDPTVHLGGFRQRIDSNAWVYRWIEKGNAARLRWRGVAFGDQGIFVRRAFFAELGGFPELPIMEDLAFMKRARRTAWPRLLPGPLQVSARRWQQHGVVRQTLRNWYLQAAYAVGVPVERLVTHYPPSPDVETAQDG